ncbi:hypothetical protein D3C76_1306260 [compost metagenome]
MAHICCISRGNRPLLAIAKLKDWPLARSLRRRSTACSYNGLPQAPATGPSASTSGTPAANDVDKVRAKRARAALLSKSPTIGSFKARPKQRSRKAA